MSPEPRDHAREMAVCAAVLMRLLGSAPEVDHGR